MWMGRWIRRGYYPPGFSGCVATARAGVRTAPSTNNSSWRVQQHLLSTVRTELRSTKQRRDWIAKHNRYASREALELARTEQERRSNELDARLMGSQAERKRWIRRHVWNRLPPLVGPLRISSTAMCCDWAFWTASPASRFISCRRSGTQCSSISNTSGEWRVAQRA